MLLIMFLLPEKSGGAQLKVYTDCAIPVSHNQMWGSLERKEGSLGISADAGMNQSKSYISLLSSSCLPTNPLDFPSKHFQTLTTFLQGY